MPRYLAIDLGAKRTGLAVGDDETDLAGPVGMVDSHSERLLLWGVRKAVEELGPDALVVGVPYDMDGKEGPAAKGAMETAKKIGEHVSLPVHLVDERLSSHEVEEQLQGRDLTHKGKKVRRDALAAAAILRRFLEQRKEEAAG